MPWVYKNGKKVTSLNTVEIVLTTGERTASLWLHDIVAEDGSYMQGIDYTILFELEVD